MPLRKLQFKPGVNQEITSYSNEGGWRDCDKIRFRFGYPEKIGGWEKYSSSTYLGSARALHNWIALDGSNYLGVGTHLKYYIEEGQAFSDITPIRSTTGAGDATFAATNGSAVITVTDSSHGAVENDFVTFSSAASLGGNITAAVLNVEHQITQIVDANSYKITASATASGSDSGNGGSNTVAAYQINVGLDSVVGGTGWGAGTWGRGAWGSAEPNGLTTTTEIRLWSHDNFGEDLLINARDSNIFYWDRTNNLSTRAIELSTISGTKRSVPTIAKQILVSDQDRHVIAFGCDGLNSSNTAAQGNGTQDPLLIRFSSQEDPIDWFPTATNTAGDIRLGAGSTFVQAVETKREILVWTDTALNSMRFIGPPFTFGLQQLASNITIMGPNAAVATEDVVFWMGIDNFYVYAGQTQQLPCTVKNKVFLDFNFSQTAKVVAGVNSEFSEVFWFYPSAASNDNDRYVVYNYGEKVWYFGNMSRSAWLDRGVRQYPIAAESSYLYNHELGYDDDGSAMNSFIESAAIDIEDGDRFVYINKVIPDLTFSGSTNLSSPQATFTVKARNFPGASFDNTAASAAIRTSESPVEKFTEQLYLRARGRSFAMRIESEALGAKWKLGSPRVDMRPDGRR
nr:constituent protein [uncultured Mediterranean phage uvMED]